MYLLSRFAKCLACALVISLMPAVAAGKGFRIAPSYPTGLYPDKVVAKDVNGDGKLDLVTLDYALISVLLGRGDGTFAPKIDYAAPLGSGLAAGDMNGDGKADLVITAVDGTLNVMLGNGNGTFQSPIITSLQILNLLDPTLGDLNKDGYLDVVIGLAGGRSNGGVLVALGKGDGTFSSQTSYAAGWHPTSVAASDLNADGKLDLAVVDQAGNLSTLLGNGDGTFQKALTIPLGYESLFVVSGEFNGDGRTDLALTVFPFYGSSLRWSVAVFFGNGDGTFQPPTLYPTDVPVYDLIVADYDHNGTQDLGVMSAGAGAGTMLNKGDGSFGQLHSYAALYAEAMTSGDLNGDGIPDLVTCSGVSLVNVFLNFGDGTFPGAPNIYLTNAYSSQYIAADFNGDGHPDLAISTFPLGVDIAISNPDGTFQAPTSYGPAADHSEMSSLTAADLNNDGKLDLAAAILCSGCPGGGAGILLGSGDGTFQSPLSITGIDDATFVAAGDFNGDGKVDLAFADDTVRIVLGNGDGTFGAASDTGVGILIDYMVAADFNHDGKLDLALGDANPQGPALIVLLGKGDGTFLNPVTYQAGTYANNLIAGDLNRDGNLDILLSGGDGLYFLLGNPDGTFQSPQQVTISTNTPLALADFNGDGKLDLAYVATDTGTLNLGYGNGDGTFQLPLVYPGIRGPLLATDFNGDHAPDLITGYSWFTPLMNSGGSTVTLSSLPNPSHFGQAVTFTATITPSLPYSPTPTGTVTFRDATKKLGTASLVAGVATFSYSGLTVGPHHISAIYSGDNSFNPNQKTVIQRVKPH
jgi:hypothetical protein